MGAKAKYLLIPVHHTGAGKNLTAIQCSSLGACAAVMRCSSEKVQDYLTLGKACNGYFVDFVIK